MAGENILVVEDEEDISELLDFVLQRDGYIPTCVGSGEEGLKEAQEAKPDLVLLDLMLPGLSGFEVCQRLKNDVATKSIPVMMLTARGEEDDIVAGFKAGADDYITKPFRPKILLARVEAVLRRGAAVANANKNEVIEVGNIKIHQGRHEVTVNSDRIDLTRTEFRILTFLASRPGWVFTRAQIVKAVHGDDYPVTGRSVDVQIAALRRKLTSESTMIQTAQGVGYRMGD